MSIRNATLRRILAASFGFVMACGNMNVGHAASTDIANVPMAVKNSVDPNVMLTLDDSGSMEWEIMPDDIMQAYGDAVYYMFPPPATNPYGALELYDPDVVVFDATDPIAAHMRSSHNNKVYYNPQIRYVPWSRADGSLMPNANPVAAYHNPTNTAVGTRNLTINTTETAWWVELGGWSYEDRTFYPATYFRYNGGSVFQASSYTRIEIRPTNAPFPKAAARTDCAGSRCSYNEEIRNFANWYTYYRARILAARGGIGKAFAQQGVNMRVGFGTLNRGVRNVDGLTTNTIVSGVRPFSGTHRNTFFTNLYEGTVDGSTPLRRALDDVGQYFSRTDDLGPWGQNPGTGGGNQYACRQNYHILTTDGYWNDSPATTLPAQENVDSTPGPTVAGPSRPNYTYAPRNPYSDRWSNTLADVAMYYWKRDLRPDLTNNVPANNQDPAFWQHVVNFTVGLGMTGTIPQATIDSAFTATPQTINWIDPNVSEPAKLDDLAHAAINSHGGFFSAGDPAAFAQALTSALSDVVGRTGASAAVAVSNPNVTATDNTSYVSEYQSGQWSGNLKAYPIDVNTGMPGTTSSWVNGGAKAQLDTLASRKIATYSGVSGIQFQPTSAAGGTKVSFAQQAMLNTPGNSDGAAVLAFLRGDRSLEGSSYRLRGSRLGDIINSEPVLLNPPRRNYVDNGYATFRIANANRPKVVFQGANDGMLHVFGGDPRNGGDEKWAYVPSFLFPSLNELSRKNYQHRYFVDATPTLADVDFANTAGVSGAPSWRTMLVGGLGKGGRGFYALDVTNPVAATEAAVAGKVLWEFPNNATNAYRSDVGYSFGKPIIVKTRAKGWVVLVTSGYNNGADTGGDGRGHLFVLNARTGAVIADIPACDGGCGSFGNAANPSGFTHMSAFVDSADTDNTVAYVYGGDLLGNIWRFDLTDSNANRWSVERLATLVNNAGQIQPVTTAPELAEIDGKPMVYVGTGQYLGDKDVPGTAGANPSATQMQSMYGLRDDLSRTPTISPLRNNLVRQTLSTTGGFRTASSNAVDLSAKKGWYIDLPDSGERVVTEPILAAGALAFTSNIPNSDLCTPGGSSWVYVLDFKTGGFLTGSTVTWSAERLGDALASRPLIVKLPSGKLKQIIRKSDATNAAPDLPVPPSPLNSRRVNWREMVE